MAKPSFAMTASQVSVVDTKMMFEGWKVTTKANPPHANRRALTHQTQVRFAKTLSPNEFTDR